MRIFRVIDGIVAKGTFRKFAQIILVRNRGRSRSSAAIRGNFSRIITAFESHWRTWTGNSSRAIRNHVVADGNAAAIESPPIPSSYGGLFTGSRGRCEEFAECRHDRSSPGRKQRRALAKLSETEKLDIRCVCAGDSWPRHVNFLSWNSVRDAARRGMSETFEKRRDEQAGKERRMMYGSLNRIFVRL